MHTLKNLLFASIVFSFSALGAEPLKVFPGWSVRVGDGERAASADPAIATTTLTGTAVSVTGKKEGRTTITITNKGATQTVDIEVQSSGWKLVPVVVAARDLPEDTELTMDNIAQRSVPEFMLTTSVVKPEAANYVLHQRILVPIQAGDMLSWSAVASKNAAKK
jgi:Flp pilus assembly protein CpaB